MLGSVKSQFFAQCSTVTFSRYKLRFRRKWTIVNQLLSILRVWGRDGGG